MNPRFLNKEIKSRIESRSSSNSISIVVLILTTEVGLKSVENFGNDYKERRRQKRKKKRVKVDLIRNHDRKNRQNI